MEVGICKRAREESIRIPKYYLMYHQKEGEQAVKHLYSSRRFRLNTRVSTRDHSMYQSVNQNAIVILYWQASPRTSGQVHCSSLASCSLSWCTSPPSLLFHTSHYHDDGSTVLYFYPSFQLLPTLGRWQLLFNTRWHSTTTEAATLEKFSTPTHYCLRWEPLHRCIFHLDVKETVQYSIVYDVFDVPQEFEIKGDFFTDKFKVWKT